MSVHFGWSLGLWSHLTMSCGCGDSCTRVSETGYHDKHNSLPDYIFDRVISAFVHPYEKMPLGIAYTYHLRTFFTV